MEETFYEAANHLQFIMGNIQENKKEKELLYLYGRYKQATVGQCNEPSPSFINFSAKRKWNAWNDLQNLSKKNAMSEYIEKIKQLDPTWEPKKSSGTASGMGVAVSIMKCTDEVEISDDEKDVFDWCKQGNIEKVQILLPEIFPVDEEKRTLLHWACDRGHLNIVEFLLNKGHDICCKDVDQSTPLHYASSCGHFDIVRLLLSRKADPSILDIDGETPKQCSANKKIRVIFEEFE